MAKRTEDQGPRERLKPSEGFASRFLSTKSPRDEAVEDWLVSTNGQIVLGLLGFVVIAAIVWQVILEPLFSAVFG